MQVLHIVDFDQLKIENQQFMVRIEERNNELLKLMLSTSRTVQVSETRRHLRRGGAGRGGLPSASPSPRPLKVAQSLVPGIGGPGCFRAGGGARHGKEDGQWGAR